MTCFTCTHNLYCCYLAGYFTNRTSNLYLQLATFAQPISHHLHCHVAAYFTDYKPMTCASTVWPLTSSRRCSSAGELGLLSALSQSSLSPPRRESSGRSAGCSQPQPFPAQMQRNHETNRCGKVNYPLNLYGHTSA